MWQIGGATFTCYSKAFQFARRQLRMSFGQPIQISYLGPRADPNNDPTKASFLLWPDMRRDYSIDPTWWENKK
jgi:hypothetical protein